MRTDPSGLALRWSDEDAARYRVEGHWQDTTLVDAARRAVAEDPARILLIEGETRLTRGAAWEQALRLAGFFKARGCKLGDVVSLQLPNWIETAVIALAARMTGLVINPIPPIYRGAELGYILADCRAKLVFVPEVFRKHDHAAMMAGLRRELPELQDVIVVRGSGALTWDAALGGPAVDQASLPKVDPASVMMVMYTSGTTGKPKGVMHVHYAFDHRVRTMGEAWGIGQEDVVFMPSPVTHITGAIWAFDMPWVRGSQSVLIDVWTADDGLRCIEANRCTVSGGATPFLQQLLDATASCHGALASSCHGALASSRHGALASSRHGVLASSRHGALASSRHGALASSRHGALASSRHGALASSRHGALASSRHGALASLRLFFCGGTTVSPDLIRQASATFPHCLFFRAYGSTEMTCATLGIRSPEEAELGADTDGVILYPTEIRIEDPSGEAVPEGEEGEILSRGPGLFVGYLHPADNDGSFEPDGFFRMGDLGRRVHGNYLVITGRKKDIIIRSGENISPKEVEDLLFTHPAVAEVAIVAMPNAATGEKGCAFIIPRQDRSIDLAEIRRFLDNAGLARQKFPEHVVLVDDLPRVPSGKVKKDVLRQRARAIAEGVEV